jgi:hypothetical protein
MKPTVNVVHVTDSTFDSQHPEPSSHMDAIRTPPPRKAHTVELTANDLIEISGHMNTKESKAALNKLIALKDVE